MIPALFWISLFLIVYTYIGYAIPLKLLGKSRGKFSTSELPQVCIIIPAYNEAGILARKIENTLALDYPSHLRQILVIADGSNDHSADVVAAFPEVEFLHRPERLGKTAALNRSMEYCKAEIVVFTDANTFLSPETLRSMMLHYNDPKVGGVSGEKKVQASEDNGAAGAGEGLYWKYESALKKIDSDFYSLCGAPGELISIRAELFEALEEDTILDDFMLSMRICLRGYRFVYEPKAIAMEEPSMNMKDEWKRKVRICAGGFQSMGRLGFISPLKFPALAYIYYSHRVFRWAVAPWCLVIAFFLNISLITIDEGYQYLMIAQLAFYGIGLLGWHLKDQKIPVKGFFVPYYFCVMNFAALRGLFKQLGGNQSAIWEKVQRSS